MVAVLAVGAGGCASTVDGTAAAGFDAGVRDVPPGVNPDGFDPFRPVEAGVDGGVILVDGATDAGTWQIPDGALFDQRYGSLWVGTYFEGSGVYTYVSAEFRYLPRPDDPRCRGVGAGGWLLQDCDLDATAVNDPHPTPFPNPGPLRVEGGRSVPTLRPNPDGRYGAYFENGVSFPEARTLRVVAPGTGSVPPLNLPVVMPAPVAVLEPQPGTTLRIDRNTPLRVRWVPSDARAVWVSLIVPAPANDNNRWYRMIFECYGDRGECTVPRQALGTLPPTRRGEQASLVVQPYNVTTVRVGAWPLNVSAVGVGQRFAVTLL